MQTPQNETKMVAPDPKRVKMVKIRAKRDIQLADGKMLIAGQEAEVSEEAAAEFTKSSQGMYAFAGERDLSDTTRHLIQRAERV